MITNWLELLGVVFICIIIFGIIALIAMWIEKVNEAIDDVNRHSKAYHASQYDIEYTDREVKVMRKRLNELELKVFKKTKENPPF